MSVESILFIGATIIVMLVVARFLNQAMMKTNLTAVITEEDSIAPGIALSGYLFGVVQITTEVLTGEGSHNLLLDIGLVALYGIGGILLLALLSTVGIKVLHGIDYLDEIRKGNVAVGIMAAGRFIATSCVIAAAVSGENTGENPIAKETVGGTALASVVFFLIGQVSLIVLTRLFRLLTSYDDTKEILSGNVAAALSYAGLMIGIGIAVQDGIKGEFTGYINGLLYYGKAMLVVLAFYPIRQFLVQGIVLGVGFSPYGGALDKEISVDRNISVGVIEATSYIATALLVTRLI